MSTSEILYPTFCHKPTYLRSLLNKLLSGLWLFRSRQLGRENHEETTFKRWGIGGRRRRLCWKSRARRPSLSCSLAWRNISTILVLHPTTLLEGEWRTCFLAGTQVGARKEWRGTLGTKNGHTVEVGLAYYNEGNGSNRDGTILAFPLRAGRGYHACNKLLSVNPSPCGSRPMYFLRI